MSIKAYVPSVESNEGFVALSQRSRVAKGKVFKKHILSNGTLLYPGAKGGKIDIDENFFSLMKKNFDSHVCPIVQAPVVDANNNHSEDPLRNAGEVIDLSYEDGKIYAHIDVRNPQAVEGIENGTLLGASAMFGTDYVDTRTRLSVPGPTLLHVAFTNRPYVVELEDFEELVAASNTLDGSKDEVVILTASQTIETDTKEGNDMPLTLEEHFAQLKDEHGIDVAELQAKAKQGDEFATLSNKISELSEGTGFVKLSNGEQLTADAIVSAFEEGQTKIVELSNRVDTLVEDGAQKAAEKKVDDLIAGGFIVPAKRDAMIKLSRSDSDLFDELIPEKPIVELSHEDGITPEDTTQEEALNAEIVRLSAVADQAK